MGLKDIKWWLENNWVDLLTGLLLLILSPLILIIGAIYFTLEYPYWCIREKRVIPSYEWIHYIHNQAMLLRCWF